MSSGPAPVSASLAGTSSTLPGAGAARPADARRIAGLPSPILTVAIFNLTLFMAWQILLPVIPLIALSMRAGPMLLGSTVGASAVLPILLALPAGRLTTAVAPRPLNLTASVLMVLATGVIWSARSIIQVMVGQALVGLSVSVASIAGQAFIGSLTQPEERDGVYGRYAFLVALNHIFGPALGGVLAAWGGPRLAVAGALAFALASVPQTFRLAREAAGGLGSWGGLRASSVAVLRHRLVLVSLAAGFLIIFGYSLRFSFYVLYLHDVGFSSKVIGLLLSISGAATLATRPVVGWATKHLGRLQLLAMISVAMGVALGLVPVVRSVFAGQAGLAVFVGMGFGLSQPLTMALLSHAVPPQALGLAFGWRQVFQRAAELVSPLVMGMVVALSGLVSVFWVAALTLILLGAATLRWAQE